MASKKTSGSVNKSEFVRSLPSGMSAADVVKAAKARGIEMTDKYVHTIRYNAKKTAAGGSTTAKRGPGRPKKSVASPAAGAAPASAPASSLAPAPAKRGPGRPRKNAPAAAPSASRRASNSGVGNGLVAELEALIGRIVETKVGEVLRSKLARIA